MDWSTLITMLALVIAPALGVYFYLKLINGPNGERYLKTRMQGPFVPTGEKKDEQK